MATKKKAKKTKKKTAASKKAKKAPKKRRIVAKASGKKATAKRRPKKTLRGRATAGELVGYQRRGLGGITGGQSGDTQGLSAAVDANSESVEELLEEGQTFEAEAIAGVENALDPDESEVVTHEFPEDDVPEEYREKNQ
jgi:N utilization substance protein A